MLNEITNALFWSKLVLLYVKKIYIEGAETYLIVKKMANWITK